MPKKCILILCGSFNPVHRNHLTLFDLAKERLLSCGWKILGGIISPTHDDYKSKKPSLGVSSHHRIHMIELSLQINKFVKCSRWEADQDHWTPTREVLDEHLNQIKNAIVAPDTALLNFPHLPDSVSTLRDEDMNSPNNFRLFLICGGDLIESFSVPNLWNEEDIESLVRDFGLIVMTREGSNPVQYIDKHPILNQYKENIHIVFDPTHISSTMIRNAIKTGISINSSMDNEVIQYISKNKLYH